MDIDTDKDNINAEIVFVYLCSYLGAGSVLCMYACMHACMYVCMCVHVCTYIYTYACI